MTKHDEISKDNRGQDLWGKFSELEKLLNADKKEDSVDQLTDGLTNIQNLVNEISVGAKDLDQKLLKAIKIVKEYSDRDHFLKFCLQLPSLDELKKSSSFPATTRSFAKDFALSFYTLDVSRWNGHSSSHRSQYLRLTDGILEGKSFKKYLWNKILNIFVDTKSMAKNRIVRGDSDNLTKEISLSDFPSIRYEIGNRYIVDCFRHYLEDAKKWEKYYFKDTFIADPITMNESDPTSENHRFVLYQSERNIFKAPHDTWNPWKCERVKISDLLKHSEQISEQYQHLLTAPSYDYHGNETYVQCVLNYHHLETPVLTVLQEHKKELEKAKFQWEAFYKNGSWIQWSRVV